MLIRLLLLAFLLVTSVMGSDDTMRLEAAKKSLESSDEIEQFRGYNECKTIYLRAILEKNNPMAQDALVEIVKAGDKLGIDVSKYASDLAKIKPITKNNDAQSIKPLIFPTQNSDGISNVPSVVYDKTLKPSSIVSKFTTPDPEKMLKPELIKQNGEVTMTMRHRLLDTQWKNSGLELQFDTQIRTNDIHMSKIIEADKQRFRYIIDIDSSTLSKSQTLEHQNINRIKMAQFDSKTLRLVIEHNQAISVRPSINGTTLFIDLALDSPKNTPPLASTPPIKTEVQEPPLIAALPPLINIASRDRSKKIIVIDPGHGGKDSGATGNGYMEKDIVLEIGTELAQRLKDQGYIVHMTRSNDTFIELKDRTKYANDKGADLFVSVHANSIPKTSDPLGAQGIETYYLSPGRSERAMRVAALENSEDMGEMGAYGKLSFLNFLNTEKIIASNKLAIDLQKGMLGNLRKQFQNVKDNNVREAPFWVLVGAQMPAVLVEVGYISHPAESSRIADEKYQHSLVEGLVEGIAHYFANNS
ncbi:MAG: N-acetylmuramoyl-L-alanine amidase [Sulfuricurvum sp.]|nr:N-acetylmuramoyl-L-alanine amidase [Sulfuricurvum sp.]